MSKTRRRSKLAKSRGACKVWEKKRVRPDSSTNLREGTYTWMIPVIMALLTTPIKTTPTRNNGLLRGY